MMHSILRSGVLALLMALPLSSACPQVRSSARAYSFLSLRDRGRLGVRVEDVTREVKEDKSLGVDHGAYVLEVVEDSPAEKAGIRVGDVIVNFDGKKIDDSGDLIREVRRAKPKTEVKVEVMRKEEHKILTATIAREPARRAFTYGFGDEDLPLHRPPRLFHSFGMSEIQGLTVEDLSGQLADYFEIPGRKGVLVTEVTPGTAGEKAGFRAGDVIVKAGGNTVRRTEDLRDELSGTKNQEISITIIRKGKPLSMTMKIDRGEGDEEDDDDASFNMIIPHGRQYDVLDLGLRYRDIAWRALNFAREYVRKFKEEVRKNLREIHSTVRLPFSNL